MAAPMEDVWTGRYRMTWMADSAAGADAPEVIFSITPAPDADPEKLSEKELERGLARWALSVAGEKTSLTLKRFHPRTYNEIDAADGIECVEGGAIFLCHVTPGTTVTLDKKEKSWLAQDFLGLLSIKADLNSRN
jgi:hypothetical protein